MECLTVVIVVVVLWESHAPCTLHTTVVDSKKCWRIVSTIKCYLFLPRLLPLSQIFNPVVHFSLIFVKFLLKFVDFVVILNGYAWMFTTALDQQTIRMNRPVFLKTALNTIKNPVFTRQMSDVITLIHFHDIPTWSLN